MTGSNPSRGSDQHKQWLARYGPWAVVTGASSGIGREFAVQLAKRGMNVVLVARRKNLLDHVAADLRTRFGVETRTLGLDLSSLDFQRQFFDAVDDLPVGLLVANAGFGSSGNLIDRDLNDEMNMVDLNCRALLAHTHHFARRFSNQRRGGVILVSSIVSWQGVPGAANYSATKAYVQSLAEGLHVELKPFGIDVLSTAPAQVSTEFAERADMKIENAASPATVAENSLRALGRKATVQPHFMSRFLSSALATVPRPIRVKIMTAVMSSMTKHQQGPPRLRDSRRG